jgi:predicted dehydrogenase
VAEGRLGTVRHVRAQYLQDWIVDPAFPLVWRLQKDRAGSGALGDIGAHIVDLAQHVLGSRIADVSGLTETFVRERPLPAASAGLAASGGAAGATGPVTVDDAALFLARFDSGVVGSFEATRFASGRKNAIRLEVNGSDGSLAFDFEAMNELHFHDHTEDAQTAGFRRILVTEPEHPYAGAWWPPGHGLGYDHAFTHQAVRPGAGPRRRPSADAVVPRRAAGAAGARGRRALVGRALLADGPDRPLTPRPPR